MNVQAVRTFGVFLLLLVSGCAVSGTEHIVRSNELLRSGTGTVACLDELVYTPLKIGDPDGTIRFSLDAKGSVLLEGDQRRFARGFLLPSASGAYSVSTTSLKTGTLYDPAIMYPEIRILDENYKVIWKMPYKDFALRRTNAGEGLNATFFVNDNLQGEKFLVISNRLIEETELVTLQRNITDSVVVTMPVPGGFATWMIPMGRNTPPIKMKASPTGDIVLEVKEYRPRKVGEH